MDNIRLEQVKKELERLTEKGLFSSEDFHRLSEEYEELTNAEEIHNQYVAERENDNEPL